MNAIRKKIEKVMYSEEKSRFFSFEFLLLVASAFYGVIIRVRNSIIQIEGYSNKKGFNVKSFP